MLFSAFACQDFLPHKNILIITNTILHTEVYKPRSFSQILLLNLFVFFDADLSRRNHAHPRITFMVFHRGGHTLHNSIFWRNTCIKNTVRHKNSVSAKQSQGFFHMLQTITGILSRASNQPVKKHTKNKTQSSAIFRQEFYKCEKEQESAKKHRKTRLLTRPCRVPHEKPKKCFYGPKNGRIEHHLHRGHRNTSFQIRSTYLTTRVFP